MISYTSVVDTASRQWGADQVLVPGSGDVVQVAPADQGRRRVTVVVDDTALGPIWCVPNAGQRRGGIKLSPGAGFTFYSAAPVYAYSSGDAATVYVVSETGAVC